MHDAVKSAGYQLERIAHQHQVGVVDDVHAGAAEVDDAAGGRGGVAEGVDVGHDVMTQLFFAARDGIEIDVIYGSFHGPELRFLDR